MAVTKEKAIQFLIENDALGVMVIDRAANQDGCEDGDVRWSSAVYAVNGVSKPAMLGALKHSVDGLEAMLVRGDYGDFESI